MCFKIDKNIKTSSRIFGYKIVDVDSDGRMTARFAIRYTPRNPTEYKLGVESRLPTTVRKGRDTLYKYTVAESTVAASMRGFYIFLTEATARKHLRNNTLLIKVSVKPKDFLHQSTPKPYGQATYRAVKPVKIIAKCDCYQNVSEVA